MTRFSDLKLDPKVLKAIEEAGYDKPTPIQTGAIPPALEGRDVLGIAQTGTGKTAGFTLPVVTLLGRGRARARMPRSLVLCPTRELAAQVAEHFDLYAKYTRLTRALLIGGVSFGEQDKLIDRGVDVLIATPGRLLDHFERGKLLLTGVQIMVVDEADRMLDMGFIPDIERIFQLTPFTRQTLFFSATMAPEIERLTNTFLHAPERIEVARQATASETIEQRLVAFTPSRKDQTARQKRELLRCLIDAEGEALTNAIIFANRKTDVDIVAKSLKAHGYDASPIHGDLNQGQRTGTLDDFREGRLRFLVASDVAARGLDIPAVSHVFNFDLPNHAEDYVHRIGRTGRAGREGIAISLTVPDDDKALSAIENLLKRPLPRADLPEGFSTSSRRSTPKPAETTSRRRRGSSRPAPETARTEPEQKAAPSTPAPAARRQPEQQNRTEGDQRGRGRHGRHDNMTGMGGHVPEFLTRSFLDALAATARNDDFDDEDDTAAEPADQPQVANGHAEEGQPAGDTDSKNTPEPAETEAKPTRTRRRRSTASTASKSAAEATADKTEADKPADPVAAEDKPAETEAPAEVADKQPETPEAKPKTTSTRRTTTAAAAKAPASDTAEEKPETAATEAAATEAETKKPATRSRPRKTTKAEDATESETATEAEAKPTAKPTAKPAAKPATRRTTTRKTAASKTAPKAEDTAAPAETESTAKPAAEDAQAEKPAPVRRTRRSTAKSKADPATDAEAETADPTEASTAAPKAETPPPATTDETSKS